MTDLEITLPLDLPTARARVTAALATQGFGILTEIDVTATLKKKIDVDFRPYTILGACNPHLAHQALVMDARVGLLLPCNVVLEQVGEGTHVMVADPSSMFPANGNAEVEALVASARGKLEAVVAALR